MKKVLWISRHPLDKNAEDALRKILDDEIQVETREVLWPADEVGCAATAIQLIDSDYDCLAGVWPAQAQQIWSARSYNMGAFEAEGPSSPVYGRPRVFAPVSEPVFEEDGKKVRCFRFVRWARII